MGYNAAGDWVPDEDLTNVGSAKPSTSNIDSQISDTEKELAKKKDLLRIANQSLQNVDPKYEMNKAYIEKLKAQVQTYTQEIGALEDTLAKLKKQKESSAKPPDRIKPPVKTAEDMGTIEVTAPRGNSVPPRRTYNPLSKFSSYTYRISLYMMSPSALATHNETGVWDKSSLYIIAQSAGADGLRAPGFELDYFIDNLEMTTLVTKDEVNGATTDFKFDVSETYGMSFPTKLMEAATKIGNKDVTAQLDDMANAMGQFFLLVVRFYGYDEKGNLVLAPTTSFNADNKTNDPGLFERAFPVVLGNMSAKLDNKTVRYTIQAQPISEKMMLDANTGAIKEALNISGETVQDILSDGTNSLIEILNKKETDLVKNNKKKVANVYKIVFEDNSGIQDALLVDKSHYVPSQAPLNVLPGGANVREANKGGAATISKAKRSIQIPAGTRIPQAIEQVISQSTYITDCLSVINKESLQPVSEGENMNVNNAKPKELVWFTIVPQVKYLDFDSLLLRNAYEITFYVKSYKIPFFRSAYFPSKTGFDGPDKIYDYWYTGKNEGVISFNMTFNSLFTAMGSMFSEGEIKNTGNIPMSLTTSMGQDTAGKLPGSSEEVASLKAWLFDPEEFGKAHLTVYGDPDFLMTASYGTFDEMSSNSIADDMPINPVDRTILIALGLKGVEDFNKDGIMVPESSYKFWKFSDKLEKQLNGRILFMVSGVKSKFSKGIFTQEFTELTMVPDDVAPDSDTNDAQTREPVKTVGGGRGGQGGPTANQVNKAIVPKPKFHDNGKPILAPATAEDENANKTLVGKGANSAAEVFNKDAVNRDSVSLLPKRN